MIYRIRTVVLILTISKQITYIIGEENANRRTTQTKTRYQRAQKSRCKLKQLRKISAHGQHINICINHQCRRRTDYPCRNEKKKRTIIAIAIAAIMFFVFNRTIYHTHRIVKGTADSMFAVPFVFMLFKI